MDSYITHTNEKTHEIVKKYSAFLPDYESGKKGLGLGPRYCPSLESKVFKFPAINSHHVFLEREGFNTNIIYPTGLSTGLPLEAQL